MQEAPAGHDMRIIPADAGSTLFVVGSLGNTRDHPRGCGEHPIHRMTGTAIEGSSPRMRGARRQCDGGQSFTVDHPRGCGEHVAALRGYAKEGGSSPRMRGAHMQSASSNTCVGIIPADAGSTGCRTVCWPPKPDHPRGCGEHETMTNEVLHLCGSSPRMRGAPAGFRPRLSGAQDHPRGCGEHGETDDLRLVCQGSSPRMRGAHRCETDVSR